MADVKTVNLKGDLPTLEIARQRLTTALAEGRKGGLIAIKLIHGYGSSGTGGVLRDGIRASLRKRRKKGEITGFIYGEDFSIFDDASRALLDRAPGLRRDPDLDRGNAGISIAVL